MIERVLHLFRGHQSLILGFNTFLPAGYKIEVRPPSLPAGGGGGGPGGGGPGGAAAPPGHPLALASTDHPLALAEGGFVTSAIADGVTARTILVCARSALVCILLLWVAFNSVGKRC